MTSTRLAVFGPIFLFTVAAYAQYALLCDNQCDPDPRSPSYQSNIGSRPKLQNARGRSNRRAPHVSISSSPTIHVSNLIGMTEALPGSQSYNWSQALVSLPGRAGLDLNLVLRYNSRVWDVNTDNNEVTFNIDRDFPSYGFRLDFGYLENDTTDGVWILTESDGGKHQMSGSGTTLNSTDSTYIQLSTAAASAPFITYANGLQVLYQQFPHSTTLFRPTQITDTNGNFISISYRSDSTDLVSDQQLNTITDTLGRVLNYNYVTNSSGKLQLHTITQSINGATFTWATFAWGTVALNYSFASGLTVSADTPTNTTVINVLTSCTLPNGTYYSFSYGDWGIVNEIDYFSKTGVKRSYQKYNLPLASSGALSDVPTYTQETISPDGTTTSNWTYATTSSNDTVSRQSITDPTGTVITLNLLPSTDNCAGAVSSTTVAYGGTTLRTITNTWQQDSVGNCQLTAVRTTLNDSGQVSGTDFIYDTNGNVTIQRDYDFGSGAIGLKLREIQTNYVAPTSNHILNLVSSVVVGDTTGTFGYTGFSYDGPQPSSLPGGGILVQNSQPPSGTPRGNLTSVTRYKNAQIPNGPITRNFTYDITGNLVTAEPDCCNQKKWSYSNTTQWAYPDSIQRGPDTLSLTTSATYYFDTGQVHTVTDENQQQTTLVYDTGTLRPAETDLPNLTKLYTQYDDSALQPTITSTNNINHLVQVSVVDGLGRVVQQQSRNGTVTSSTVISTVDTAYDSLGRPTSISNPYAPGDTEVYTTTTYDHLSRATQVSPPSGGSYQTSYNGNAVTSTDPASKQIRRFSDGLGRLIEVDEPGAGPNSPGTSGSGTISISGSLQTGTNPGTKATGSFTVNGTEGVISTPRHCYADPDTGLWICDPPSTTYDSGTVNVSVNGWTASASYGQNSTSASVAAALASAFGASGSPVSASYSGSTVYLTANQAGPNYSMSSSSQTDDPADFTPSFTVSLSGANMTGGAYPSTTYDSGTLAVSVNGFQASASYNQNLNNAASAMAQALANSLNGSGSPVTASVSGTTISITARTVGTSTNYSVSGGTSTSFTASSTTLSGGTDPSGIYAPNKTTYAYRPTGELTSVTSGVQTRTYVYDDLGRPTSNTLPESGQTQFTYLDFGGVQTRTDARGVITSYSYDGLNRLATISYNVGATGVQNPGTVTFNYGTSAANNTNGRLVSMVDGSGEEDYAYNTMGWMTQLTKKISGTNYTIGYAYNGLGELTDITYPSTHVVHQSYDSIGRLSGITNQGANAFTVGSYNATGQVLGATYGNGVSGAFTYNDHLQISRITYTGAGTTVGQTLLDLTYGYGTNNNGQIASISDGRGAAYNEQFSYDALGRLVNGQTGNLTAPNTWCLNWNYDRYGNRLSQSGCGGMLTVGQPNLSASGTTNRINSTGYSYDANGNMIADPNHSYQHDAENRLISVDNGATASYTYDGNGMKVINGTTTYVRSGAKPIAEYAGGSLQREYVLSGGRLLATVVGTSVTYHHPDYLSNRVETDASGNVVRTFGHVPFGDIWYETGTPDRFKFTSYDHSNASGLDYAIMRHYSNALGRFMSPDLLPGSILVPQSLNRYSYVLNDPCNATDPLGLKQTCTLNVKLVNDNDIKDPNQVKQIEADIKAVFGGTNTSEGNTLGIEFVDSDADATLHLQGEPSLWWQKIQPGSDESAFMGITNHYTSDSYVFTSHTLQLSGFTSPTLRLSGFRNMTFEWLTAMVGAHELFHAFLKTPLHDTYDSTNPNIMMFAPSMPDAAQDAALRDINNPLWFFSQAQIDSLYGLCQSRHRQRSARGGGEGKAGDDPILPVVDSGVGGGFGSDPEISNEGGGVLALMLFVVGTFSVQTLIRKRQK